LRKQLRRRGLTVAGAVLAAMLEQQATGAAVPPQLTEAAVRAATGSAASSAAGGPSARVAAMAEAGAQALLAGTVRYVASVVLLAAMVLGGAALALWSASQNWWDHSVGSSRTSGPAPKLEPSPDLAKAQITCELVGVGCEEDHSLFWHVEKHYLNVRVSTKVLPVDNDTLVYTLYGANDLKLSEGLLRGEAALQPGQQGGFQIADPEIPKCHRVVIRKKES
jgi:hypothetical protein